MKKLYLLSVLALASCGYMHGAGASEGQVPEEFSVEELRTMSTQLDGARTEEDRVNVMTRGGQYEDFPVFHTLWSMTENYPEDSEEARLAQEVLRKAPKVDFFADI